GRTGSQPQQRGSRQSQARVARDRGAPPGRQQMSSASAPAVEPGTCGTPVGISPDAGATGTQRARAEMPPAVIRRLGRVDYESTWRAMQRFTDERDCATPDEIWFLEHPRSEARRVGN